MKFNGRIYRVGILNIFFVVSIIAFLPSIEVFAHEVEKDGESVGSADDRAASDVNVASEEEVKQFLSHVAEHYDFIMKSNPLQPLLGLSDISRELRTKEVYKAPEMYTILIDSGGTVLNHPGYPNLFGYRFNLDSTRENGTPAKALKSLIEGSSGGDIVCEEYEYGGKTRVACGTRGGFGDASIVGNVITIAVGLHHGADGVFSEPDCSSFPRLPVTAEDVYDDPTEDRLKGFVKSAIESTKQALRSKVSELYNETDPDLTDARSRLGFLNKLTEAINGILACYTLGGFKHENIYLFVMKATPDGTVIINGNNSDLNGLTLQLEDDQLPGDDKKITTLFRNALTEGNGDPKVGQSATVNYRWSNPERTDDKVDNWLETNKVPGTSLKTSYIEVMNIMSEAIKENPELSSILSQTSLNIFGSGIYPKTPNNMPKDKDDDNGCAVAGKDHSSQSALINLLLTASVLFSVVLLRRRA